ncbi:hypothetical protein GCM10026982_45490 [Nocardiopsis aegyptia]
MVTDAEPIRHNDSLRDQFMETPQPDPNTGTDTAAPDIPPKNERRSKLDGDVQLVEALAGVEA